MVKKEKHEMELRYQKLRRLLRDIPRRIQYAQSQIRRLRQEATRPRETVTVGAWHHLDSTSTNNIPQETSSDQDSRVRELVRTAQEENEEGEE